MWHARQQAVASWRAARRVTGAAAAPGAGSGRQRRARAALGLLVLAARRLIGLMTHQPAPRTRWVQQRAARWSWLVGLGKFGGRAGPISQPGAEFWTRYAGVLRQQQQEMIKKLTLAQQQAATAAAMKTPPSPGMTMEALRSKLNDQFTTMATHGPTDLPEPRGGRRPKET